jgi:hypothetical protein
MEGVHAKADTVILNAATKCVFAIHFQRMVKRTNGCAPSESAFSLNYPLEGKAQFMPARGIASCCAPLFWQRIL